MLPGSGSILKGVGKGVEVGTGVAERRGSETSAWIVPLLSNSRDNPNNSSYIKYSISGSSSVTPMLSQLPSLRRKNSAYWILLPFILHSSILPDIVSHCPGGTE